MPRKRKSTKPLRPARQVRVGDVTAPTAKHILLENREGLPVKVRSGDFQSEWDALPPRQKDRVRAAAEERGMTLQAYHRLFPDRFRGQP